MHRRHDGATLRLFCFLAITSFRPTAVNNALRRVIHRADRTRLNELEFRFNSQVCLKLTSKGVLYFEKMAHIACE